MTAVASYRGEDALVRVSEPNTGAAGGGAVWFLWRYDSSILYESVRGRVAHIYKLLSTTVCMYRSDKGTSQERMHLQSCSPR